jgi:predicted amidophosphoribosyltransferase
VRRAVDNGDPFRVDPERLAEAVQQMGDFHRWPVTIRPVPKSGEASSEPPVTLSRHTASVLDLVLPLECGGCGAPSTRWCDVCAKELAINASEPHVVNPRLDPGVPVFALGRYAGARRRAVIAMKDHGRTDLIAPLSRALAAGIHRMLTWGMIDVPLTIVPAPTRRSAARRRGGDPVTRMVAAAVAKHPGIDVVQALRVKAFARDSARLGSAAREHNLAGAVLLRRRRLIIDHEVLLVDDIVTTGATARESVRTLHSAGVRVAAVLTIAHA